MENKKIVVTGAASGIGAETANVLKAKGATIVGVDRNEPKENVDQFIKADLGDPDELRQPRSGRNTDSAGLSGNPGRTGRRGRKDHGSSGTSGRYRTGNCLYVQRRQQLDQGCQHPLRRRHVSTSTL